MHLVISPVLSCSTDWGTSLTPDSRMSYIAAPDALCGDFTNVHFRIEGWSVPDNKMRVVVAWAHDSPRAGTNFDSLSFTLVVI